MTLIAILVAPMILLGVVAFALIVSYVHRVSRVTAELEARKRQALPGLKPDPTACPACGHRLVEVRRFCAECGAPIRPEEPPTPAPEQGASADGADVEDHGEPLE